MGETRTLRVLGVYDDASQADLTSQVTFESRSLATISASDTATGISSTATLGDATVVCAGDILALRIDPPSVDLDDGKSRQMRAYRIFSDGHEVDVTRRVLWTSSHPQGVSIVETGSPGGMATAHGDVVATIAALDSAFGVRSSDPGGNDGRIAVRKTRTKLEIFPIYPTASPDGVFRGRVGELARLRARVTYKS